MLVTPFTNTKLQDYSSAQAITIPYCMKCQVYCMKLKDET